MASLRQQRLEAIVSRLQEIQPANGYQTDAGQKIFLGETAELGPDDPEQALAVVPGDPIVGPNRIEQWPIEIQGLAKADLEAPHLAAEAILADVALAIETADRTLGSLVKNMDNGPARTLPREPGSTTVGCGITYMLTYVRQWGTF